MGYLIERISDFFKHGSAKLSPELRELLQLDNEALADIGLTRGEVEDFAAGRIKTMRRIWERPDPIDEPVAANANTDRRRHLHLVA